MYPIFDSPDHVEQTLLDFNKRFPIVTLVENSKVFQGNANHLNVGYHNNRHMKLVANTVFLMAYNSVEHERLSAIMTAALLHDIHHSGYPDNEAPNIEKAVASITSLKDEVIGYSDDNWRLISEYIKATEWPHREKPKLIFATSDEIAILRDADILSVLTSGGVELILNGFRNENLKRFVDWPGGANQLKAHVGFIENYQPYSKEGVAFKDLLRINSYRRWANHLYERDGGDWLEYVAVLNDVKTLELISEP